MIDCDLGEIPVFVVADFNYHRVRFICDHDFVERCPDVGEVLVFMAVLIELHEGNGHALPRIDLCSLVRVVIATS